MTGNGNDRYIDSGDQCAYKYVVTVSSLGDHTKPVDWLLSYLLCLRDAIARGVPVRQLNGVDLLGLSRGHMALMACCETRRDQLHMRLSAEYRYFMAAGGASGKQMMRRWLLAFCEAWKRCHAHTGRRSCLQWLLWHAWTMPHCGAVM